MSDLAALDGLPRWHPPLRVLEFAELVLTGALRRLPAGLAVPVGADGQAIEGPVVLEDAEGTPVAVLDGARAGVTPVRPFAHGPLRGSRRTPAQVVDDLAMPPSPSPSGVLAVPVATALGRADVEAIQAKAASSGQAVLWIALIGQDDARYLPEAMLWRAVRAVALQTADGGTPSLAVPIAVPFVPVEPGEFFGPLVDQDLIDEVARSYGATEIWHFEPGYFLQPGQADDVHPIFDDEFRLAFERTRYHGVTVFFTGLSGSGKSTVAKALADRVAEGSEDFPGRTVSLLDGDEVRRMLSAGLGFSRADRDLNILRIGYVAAEITKHGGLAICAPIAPFDDTRQQVRQMVSGAGQFLLVHVNTPLAECERRDRKGLYAKARAGELAEFTGISSPYEEPADADLTLDTSTMSVGEAVVQVLELLRGHRLLTPAGEPGPPMPSSPGAPRRIDYLP